MTLFSWIHFDLKSTPSRSMRIISNADKLCDSLIYMKKRDIEVSTDTVGPYLRLVLVKFSDGVESLLKVWCLLLLGLLTLLAKDACFHIL